MGTSTETANGVCGEQNNPNDISHVTVFRDMDAIDSDDGAGVVSEATTFPLASAYWDTAFVFCIFFMDLYLATIVVSIFPYVLEDIGPVEYGLLLASKSTVQILASPGVATMTKRTGRPLLVCMAGAVCSMSVGIAYAFTSHYYTYFAARASGGIFSACIVNGGFTHIAEAFPEGQGRGRAMGLVMNAIALGCLAGPPVGGILFDRFGQEVAFLSFDVLVLGGFVVYGFGLGVAWYLGEAGTEGETAKYTLLKSEGGADDVELQDLADGTMADAKGDAGEPADGSTDEGDTDGGFWETAREMVRFMSTFYTFSILVCYGVASSAMGSLEPTFFMHSKDDLGYSSRYSGIYWLPIMIAYFIAVFPSSFLSDVQRGHYRMHMIFAGSALMFLGSGLLAGYFNNPSERGYETYLPISKVARLGP
mmetsp:Transcript_13209/g.37502  ORF Transcript_13209/g.37502 Transcript_13209/m.37502 type:complete len:421 (-) Transcript_13209:862-2124(-)